MPDITQFDPVAIVLIAIGAPVVIFVGVYGARLIYLCRAAKKAGFRATVRDWVSMRSKKVDAALIFRVGARAAREGLTITPSQLEYCALAGGDVCKVVDLLLAARDSGVEMDWMRACTLQIADREEARQVSP